MSRPTAIILTPRQLRYMLSRATGTTTRQRPYMFSRRQCTSGLRSDSASILDIGVAEEDTEAITGVVDTLGAAATTGEAGIGSAVGADGVEFPTIGNIRER
ncbi:hypothetical protein TSA66_05530 [Noviherbaspirillum autotrophicum]|uniref:Uncharacterized protein n=1 Tax=Noviherbaspirillum autotrophicum TaxID=709839 RepID=A0A0C2BGQ3_9BURK|nr:hypothetical protein TSA66_05530 [Noviherbaspirillum autotrophicum]